MLKIFWYVFIAIIIALSLAWVLDNNGMVTILWLGYEIKTDILTAIIISLIFFFGVFAIIYLLEKLFSFKPSTKKDSHIQ